ncbi:MAG: hypothetical protein MUF42_12905 [Cytophagaceae bacterium]|jgi:photosystem II stability/assembly factor-like uncharacterized protein|nr:hypothetical protein [Cytophagaceae bacterium]
MRKYVFTVLTMLASMSVSGQSKLAQALRNTPNNFFAIQKTAEAYFQNEAKAPSLPGRKASIRSLRQMGSQEWDSEYVKFKRWEWYWRDRVLPDGSFPDLASLESTNKEARSMKQAAAGGAWSCFSQTNTTGGYNGMGRATSIAFHPSNPDIYYVGAPIGGIWKTTNRGASYTALGDQLLFVSVGEIQIDYNNPNTIYISIGDNTGWWNPSLGVMKSTDGGLTWANTGLSFTFNAGVAIYRLEISPTNSNVLIAATTNGIYRTTNGGTNWTQVRAGSHGDVKFRPGDGNTVYAASDDYWGNSNVYRSNDGGVNWTQVSNFNTTNSFLRINVSAANNNKIVAIITNGRDFYVSNDQGNTWTQRTDVPEDAFLYISPVDANVIYSGYVNVYRSNDNGGTWTKITHWHGGMPEPEVHADHHYAKHNPADGNIMYFCCDGGIYKHQEQTNNWWELNNSLVITQFYRLATAQNNANVVIGGTQDNGGRKRDSGGAWSASNGGDAMEVAIDPGNYNIFYTTYVNGQLYRTMDFWNFDSYHDIRVNIPGAPDGDWVTPYVIDPNNNATLVAGYKEVYRSTNRGDSWTQISAGMTGNENLHCIAVAKGNSNIIYASRNNIFYATTNMGANWNSYTLPNSERITSITVHPTNSSTIYVTRSGYNAGDKVFQSTNGGATWTNISGTLPNVPINGSVFYEASPYDGLFIGGDRGVFYRDNTMSDWIPWGNGLPNTSVTDLEIYKAGKKLRISTFGRGMWELDINDVPLPANISNLQGKWKNPHEVHLWWDSYYENNFDGYQILRSMNGLDFEEIGFEKGRNSQAKNSLYQLSDSVGTQVSMVYYRLGLKENSGLVFYSPILKIERQGDDWVQSMHPIPAIQEFSIYFTDQTSEVTYSLWSADGKQVRANTTIACKDQTCTIPVNSLTSGQYIIQLNSKGKSHQQAIQIR